MNNLQQLMRRIDAEAILPGDAHITDLRTDSREVRDGTLFLARVGAEVDGHQYLKAAVARGASAVLVTRPDAVPNDLGVPAYAVSTQDPTYGLLAADFFGHPTQQLRVYGVTGTNGKSSTAWMLDHLLRTLGRKPALISTLMYRVGASNRSEEHTSELQSRGHLVCRLLLEKKKTIKKYQQYYYTFQMI